MSDERILAGRWRLLKQLGEGRAGSVWSARDGQAGPRVAVKLLHRQLRLSEQELRRFAREFEVLSRITHPNVVRAIEFGTDQGGEGDGQSFLVMEHVEGRRLSELIQAGPLEVPRAARLALEIARALEAAHALDVVHRDLEPGNVLVVRSRMGEQVKVLDFGVARLTEAEDEDLTAPGQKLGTAEYMSPEYVNEGAVDRRSDLYALGVLLYAMLTGGPPFVGPTLKVMQDHVTTQVPAPGQRASGLPPWLEVLTMRLLAKDPEARPQSATEVIQEIGSHLSELEQEQSAQRQRMATLPPATLPVAGASISHYSGNESPVYPDPEPVPRLPIAIAATLGGLAMLGVVSVVGILLLLYLL